MILRCSRLFALVLTIITVSSASAFAEPSSDETNVFHQNCSENRAFEVDVNGYFPYLYLSQNYRNITSYINTVISDFEGRPAYKNSSRPLSKLGFALFKTTTRAALFVPEAVRNDSKLGCEQKSVEALCYVASCSTKPAGSHCREFDITQEASNHNQTRAKLFRLARRVLSIIADLPGHEVKANRAVVQLRKVQAEFPEISSSSLAIQYNCALEN